MVKTNIIENLFFHILIYSFLLPILGILLYFKILKSKAVFSGILVYCLCIMAMLYFDEFLSSTNRFRHLYTTSYTVLEYSIFSYIIWFFVQSKRLKNIILVLYLAFILFEIIYFFTGKFSLLDSVPIGVETILIFCQIFFLFYEQFQKASQHFYITPSFWFVIGIMIYLAGSFFFNILANSETRELIIGYWFFTYIFEILKNILFLVAIVLYAKRTKDNILQKTTSIPYLDIDLT